LRGKQLHRWTECASHASGNRRKLVPKGGGIPEKVKENWLSALLVSVIEEDFEKARSEVKELRKEN
jgi:hypothetical protein